MFGGCLLARQDARIRPGGQVGVTTAIIATPDAEAHYVYEGPAPEGPDVSPASPSRGITEMTIAYGWPRAELRFHVPWVRWADGDDFKYSSSDSHVELTPQTFSLELYVLAIRRHGWFAGLGVETSRGGYASATYELAPRHALTLTLRAVYVDKDGAACLAQAQLAYTYELDPKHDLRVFVAGIDTVGDGAPALVRVSHHDYLSPDTERDYVLADRMAMFGASIDWH